jgi:uncharacterized protein YggU (UPF0235/DUF167 family)
VVHVRSRALEGAATREACRAVADAFGVRASAVRCVKGEHARTKVLSVDGDDSALADRLRALRSESAR